VQWWRIVLNGDTLARMIPSSLRLNRGIVLAICLSGFGAHAQSNNAQSTNDELLQKYAQAGQQALAAGRYAEAEKNFAALEKLDPSTAEVHATLGVIYYTEKKFDQAVVEIREAQRLKPELPQLATLLALSLSELGHFEEALPNLEEGFRQSTEPSVKRMCGLQLMRVYTGLQRDSDAVQVALELDKLYPGDAEVLYHTSKVYGNFAFLNMEKLRREAPHSVWRHLGAAEAYESEGKYDEAIGEYHEVLLIEPHRLGVHYRIGRTLLARASPVNPAADTLEAKKEFEQELALDPHNGNATYELAEIHRSAGEIDQAQKLFERALEDYPDFEEAHIGLAAVYMTEKQFEQAQVQLQKAIALNADNEVSWYRLSQVERALGNASEQQKAVAEFQRLQQRAHEQMEPIRIPSANDVTKQELDRAAAK
jgi:tetratricopeptide (TPR) repeat protein